MHIWNDFGPTGYSTSEIARLSIPTILTFSEKMWGTKGYASYPEFQKKMQLLLNIPNTQILNRSTANEKTVYSNKKKINLVKNRRKKIKANSNKIEYPWSLEMTLKRTKETPHNELLFSSPQAAIYTQLEFEFKKKKTSEMKKGFAIVRANQTEGESPLTSHRPQVIIFDYQFPNNKEVHVKIIGEKGKTSMYADGVLVGSENIQMLCPLEYIGSSDEKVFQGTIKHVLAKRNREK